MASAIVSTGCWQRRVLSPSISERSGLSIAPHWRRLSRTPIRASNRLRPFGQGKRQSLTATASEITISRLELGGFKMHSRVPCFVVGTLSLVFSNLSGAQGYQWTEIVVEGATVIQVFGLNDKGQTATSTSIGSGIYGNGTFTPLPPPPQLYQVTALGINNGGVITGVATTAGIQQGFILRGSTY